MKKLLSTTALVFTLGLPALTLAQTTPPVADLAAMPAVDPASRLSTATPGFLAERGQMDMFASDLIGHDVHAHRIPAGLTRTDGRATSTADGKYASAAMKRAELAGMDTIGQINEIELSRDGRIRALVIGVGDFPGIGSSQAPIGFDELTILSTEGFADVRLYVDATREQIQSLPQSDFLVAAAVDRRPFEVGCGRVAIFRAAVAVAHEPVGPAAVGSERRVYRMQHDVLPDPGSRDIQGTLPLARRSGTVRPQADFARKKRTIRAEASGPILSAKDPAARPPDHA